MFALPAFASLMGYRVRSDNQRIAWLLLMLVFILLVGFRHEVGGDWFTYLRKLASIHYQISSTSFSLKDPGYYGINWLASESGLSIHWVNLFCGTIVILGVSVFSKNQPLPWLSLTVAVPYLLVVVAMGYTRQASALGIVLIGLTALAQHKTRRFVALVLLAATFHKSAILMLPIAALAASERKVWTYFWVGITSLTAAYLFLAEEATSLWANYIEADMQSQGGLIRVVMNVVPSVILLATGDRLFNTLEERKLWRWMAIFSLMTLPLVMISSTAVDRIALYFIPIQMFSFSRFPFLFGEKDSKQFIVLGVVAYYGLVLFVWLNFSFHAPAWLPYQNYIFL
jgi:EpsG-like putative glucosyltransferase